MTTANSWFQLSTSLLNHAALQPERLASTSNCFSVFRELVFLYVSESFDFSFVFHCELKKPQLSLSYYKANFQDSFSWQL